MTHALSANSPAINMGISTGAPPTDQRGVARPQGTGWDLGAYEFERPLNHFQLDLATQGPGKISSYLVRPVSYHGYALSLDLAQKTVHVISAVLEVGLLALLVRGQLFLPRDPATYFLFAISVVLSSLLFFFLEFMVSSLAFWTSESGGPLFCFELFLQFAAGAFFPLDVLPKGIRMVLESTPFPYMVYFPVRIFLNKVTTAEAMHLLSIETAWLMAVTTAAMLVWNRGLRVYSAEGG